MDTNPLEMLLGAGANPQQAFVSILIDTLKRIEGKVDGLLASDRARAGEIAKLDARLTALEDRDDGRSDGIKTWVPVVVSFLTALAGLLIAVFKQH